MLSTVHIAWELFESLKFSQSARQYDVTPVKIVKNSIFWENSENNLLETWRFLKSNESEIGQLNMVNGRATLMNRIMADDLATPNLEQTDDVRLNLHSEHLNNPRLIHIDPSLGHRKLRQPSTHSSAEYMFLYIGRYKTLHISRQYKPQA